ncbi:Endonuclease/exonuclease/phosphatase [Aspergillus crustosus]
MSSITDALQIYFLTYNCGLALIDVEHFSRHFFDALPVTDSPSSPDLIVLSLQEIAPLPYAFLGGSFLTPYFASFTQAVDRATNQHLNAQYVNVLTDHSGMTGLMVFARSDVVDHLSPPDIARVGFGPQEIGNKGAVGARLSYNPSKAPQAGVDITLIAAHLAPMEDAVEQRNKNWRSLVESLVFSESENKRPTAVDGNENEESESAALLPGSTTRSSDPGIFAPSNYLFLGGDLNYRTADRFPSKTDYLRYPKANAEPGDPLHFSELLKHDQLKREMGLSNCFHGLSEAPITFPPTYKYHADAQAAARDPLTPDRVPEWIWSSHRWPSWCDRILFLNSPPGLGDESKIKVLNYDALPVSPTSDHRPVALTVSIPVTERRASGEPHTVAPFPIDPNWESRREAARRKEYIAGCIAYLGMTWEGNGLALGTTFALLGAWFVVRSMFSS